MLSPDHEELVLQQCANQHVTDPNKIDQFRYTYGVALTIAYGNSHISASNWKSIILVYGATIEDCNKYGVRNIPVTFANGTHGLAPELIERALDNLCDALENNALSPEEAYLEFEKIHPFEDGNGRVGHLLWATLVMWQDGEWPMRLPPQMF